MAPTTVRDLTPAPYNPRRITDEKLAALGRSMARFGDLSGIVFNRRTGRVVGGHQRLKHLPPDAVVTITERLGRANEQGTVALGYVDWHGERWSYREVDWAEEDEKAANIAANKHGGEWDMPQLADLIAELDAGGYAIELLGFDEQELQRLLSSIPDGSEDGAAPALGDVVYQVVVTCRDEVQQAELCAELEEKGYECRLLTL